MRRSKVLERWRGGEFARVCSLGHFLPFYIRHAAHCAYEGIWLDLEHRAMAEREVQTLLALCHYNDVDCMVRPPTIERGRLYRYLEDGASGFMIPFVSSVETARQVVSAVKFPPLGNRGIDGAGLDADYLLHGGRPDNTYTDDANRETFIVAQIETPEAVANVEAIAAVPGIDCLFVGPGDLGLRLSRAPDGAAMALDEAVERVAAAARAHGASWGIAISSHEQLVRYRQMGAQLLPWGNEFALVDVLQSRKQDLDHLLAR
jgi:2-keto-3-deoxy-L-rhamnonate aldolase RhmA